MKQKLSKISFIMLIVSLFAVLSFSVAAQGEAFANFTETENNGITVSDVYAVVDGQKILSSAAKGETYVFLPSSANLSAVTFGFSLPENAELWVYDGTYCAEVKSGDALNISGAIYNETTNSYDLTLRAVCANEEASSLEYSQSVIKFMKSEKVAAMYINSGDPAYARKWVDSTKQDAAVYADYKMALVEEDSNVVYNGKLTQIKGRGNSTWLRPKKPYQIKLDKKTDLLCSGDKANKNKTWILLANAIDKTLFKNAFAYDLARYFGLKETPEYRFVDLYFDGEYRGTYFLCEKVQINDGRVETKDLEDVNVVENESATAQAKNKYGCTFQYNPTATCTAEDITGGYLLEHDDAFYRTENSWFKTSTGNTIVIKSPECATKEQVQYISEFYNEMMLAAVNGSYNGVSIEEYADIDSFASLYIINEYMKNIDFSVSSTYFFLPEEGNAKYEHKFYAGPAWDFDTSLGNRIEQDWMSDPDTIFRDTAAYFRSQPVRFAIAEKAREIDSLYDLFFSEEPVYDAEKNLSSFSQHKANIYASAKMNFTLWPCDNTENAFAFPTYEENYEYTRDFLKTRHNLIIGKIASWDKPIIEEPEDPVEPCDHICHKDGFEGFIYKILRFFWKLFGTNKVCECGVNHYNSRSFF